MPPGGPLQRQLHGRLLDALTLGRRPRPAGMTGPALAVAAAVVRRAIDPDDLTEAADRQVVLDSQELQLDEGNPSGPPRLSTRSSTCASPSARVSSSSCASSWRSRPDGPRWAPASKPALPPARNCSFHLPIDVSEIP